MGGWSRILQPPMKRSYYQKKHSSIKDNRPTRGSRVRRKFRWLDLSDVFLTLTVAIVVLGISLKSLRNWWDGSVVGAAHIVEIHGKVSRRAEDALSWYDVAKDQYVKWEEHLKTEKTGAARLRFENGAEVDLQAESQAYLKRSGIELSQGKFRLQSGWEKIDTTFAGDLLSLKPSTETYLLMDPATGREQIVVTKGEATLTALHKKPYIIHEGETFRVKPEELLLRVDPALTFEPLSPKSGETIISPDTAVSLNLKWKGQAERIEIDKTPGFLNPKIYAYSETGFNLMSSVGRYFWRLGSGNRVSDTSDFLVLPSVSYQVIAPKNQSYVVSQGEITFKWQPIANASHYLIQLSRWPDFKDPLVSQSFTTTEASLNPIPPGAYYWRIQATYKDLGDWPSSEAYTFAVGKTKLREREREREATTQPRIAIHPKKNGPTP